jgi:hypothetical protein
LVQDSTGLNLRFDEDERLDTIQATYRLNENGGFSSSLVPIPNEGGTFNTTTLQLVYNINAGGGSSPLAVNDIALLKQYYPSGTESYYYVKVLTSVQTGTGPIFTYTQTVEAVKYVNNANLGSITLWNTLSGYSAPGIFYVPPIMDDYVTNGLTSTDISPAGEIYNINSDSKIFHVFDCGQGNLLSPPLKLSFWENADETYDNTADWDVKDSSGTITDSFKNEKIRHHKMPGPENIQQSTEIWETANLGLKISNIILPAELENEISQIKIYYAKRTNSNRSVLGQSLIIHDFYLTYDGTDRLEEGVFSLSFNNSMEFYSDYSPSVGRFLYRQLNRFRMSPFDISSSNLDVSSATHFKAFKKIYAELDYWGSVGTSAWNNNSGNDPRAADARFYCFEQSVSDQKKSSYIRRFTNAKFTVSCFDTIDEVDYKILCSDDMILYKDYYTITKT